MAVAEEGMVEMEVKQQQLMGNMEEAEVADMEKVLLGVLAMVEVVGILAKAVMAQQGLIEVEVLVEAEDMEMEGNIIKSLDMGLEEDLEMTNEII